MFIQRIRKKTKKKTYTSVVLMQNYREGKKVKHRIIANLSKWPDNLITGLDKLLKGQKIISPLDMEFTQGKSIGAIFVILEVAKRLGIKQSLGNSKQAGLALFQIAGRIISHGSRNYLANEWIKNQEIEEVFGVNNFSEDTLYKSLDWLSDNQDKIERKLYSYRVKTKVPAKEVILYDVTSSYLEGDKNELGAYGYNRDKKKGKKQIVIGLITGKDGYPISVEVFKGNTGDTTTVTKQLEKLKKNFGIEKVIFVGDKGMVRTNQIKEIISDTYKWNYLTTITKQQINTLIEKKVIDLSLFDKDIVEIEVEDNNNNKIRYILRRNPIRAEEIRDNREGKLEAIDQKLKEQNRYLQEHKRAKLETAIRRVEKKIGRLRLKKIVSCRGLEVRKEISIMIDKEAQQKEEELDGCYVLKTNVPIETLDAQTAHERYKDLAKVEFAFRTMKTTLEKIRPVYVQKEKRTRGHVFVVMLAYMIIKYITDRLSGLDYTRNFIIESLDKIQCMEYQYEDKKIKIIPQKLLEHQDKIIKGLKIRMKL